LRDPIEFGQTVKRLLLLLALTCPALQAAEVTPFLKDARLGVALADVKLPPNLQRDLVSGLGNHILVRVALTQGAHELARSAIDINVTYDLWDETFSMQVTGIGLTEPPRVLRTLDETVAALSHLTLSDLIKPDPSWNNSPLVASVELLFNPIEREQMDELRKWVTDNSGPARTEIGRDVSLPAEAPSESRAWFNRIFSQYSAGAGIAAATRDHGLSTPFRLRDLPEQPGDR
jgi:hypothetical protein